MTLHTLTGLTWRTSSQRVGDAAARRFKVQVGDLLITLADYNRTDGALDLAVLLARVDFPFHEPPAVRISGVTPADLPEAIGNALARCVVAAIRSEDLDDLPALSLPPAIEAFYLAELRNRLRSAKAHALREADLFGHLLGKVSP